LAALNDPIQFLPGVGPKRAETLKAELQIETVEDLLHYYPYKHIDRSKFYSVASLNGDLPYVQVRGRFINFAETGKGLHKRLNAIFADETGEVDIVWFRGTKWIQEKLKTNVEYVLFGKPSWFLDRINIAHPEIEEWSRYEASLTTGLQPQYSLTEKLRQEYITSKTITKLMETAWSKYVHLITETLPSRIIDPLRLMPLKQAILQIHFPDNDDLLNRARFRLKYEELFDIQLKLQFDKKIRERSVSGYFFPREKDNLVKELFKKIPFQMTGAQIRVLGDIRKDVTSGRQMNRLLQGDVGSGKTMVALFAMLMAADSGAQACIMVPTEILAQQHYRNICKMLEGLPVKTGLLTGSTRKKERKVIHEALMDGSMHLLVGTHALIEDTVNFARLGLVVIDEQHRFGVAQRSKLWMKSNLPPHVLVMTATPIPRTLAMTLYGDLDVSVIDEMPPGRKPIQTQFFSDSQRLTLFSYLKREIEKGRQVFVVFPLINESKKLNYKDLADGYESYSRAFPPPQYAITMVHGQMKNEEKEESMKYFVQGQSHIMVATTVIEVGVDVPNASVMVIESAERFGLSQLHQLRGRVGRGADQSYCYLMAGTKLSNDARTRLQAMVNTTDGFELSELDMKLRGHGDLEGTQQSGDPMNLRIASLVYDSKILQLASDTAKNVLSEDPGLVKPENAILRHHLKVIKTQVVDWSRVS
jgi:ATP-dependent DNA helicase RecG